MKPMLARKLELDLREPADGETLADVKLEAAKRYIDDPTSALEPKLNGRRLLLDCAGEKPLAFNREGDRTDIPLWLRPEVAVLQSLKAIVDGELMADSRLYVFDLVRATDVVTVGAPWKKRQAALQALLAKWQPARIAPVPVATKAQLKRGLAKRIFTGGFEGFILKRIDGPYEPGRRSAHWLKVKNTRTVDCVVMELGTDTQNVKLGVYADGVLTPIGTCSRLEGDAPMVGVGDVIEVEFLDSGDVNEPRLYQAHAKSLRIDKAPLSCTIDQIDGTASRKELPR